MDQQNKTKPEENQNKSAELSDQELEQVAGGKYGTADASYGVKSPRDSASGQAKGFNASTVDDFTIGQ